MATCINAPLQLHLSWHVVIAPTWHYGISPVPGLRTCQLLHFGVSPQQLGSKFCSLSTMVFDLLVQVFLITFT
jgi:hypothetical protein